MQMSPCSEGLRDRGQKLVSARKNRAQKKKLRIAPTQMLVDSKGQSNASVFGRTHPSSEFSQWLSIPLLVSFYGASKVYAGLCTGAGIFFVAAVPI
jgi:hypothetical protein